MREQGIRMKAVSLLVAMVLAVGALSSPAYGQSAGSRGSNVNGYIEFDGGGRPSERLEIQMQTPTGGSRIRVISEPGGTFVVRNLRPGTYEFTVQVPKAWPFQDGTAELIIVGSSTSAPTTYTVTVFLRRKSPPAIAGVSGRTISAQETDENVSKEARRLYRQGVDAVKASKTNEAIASFRKALEIEPAFLFALNDLGVQLTRKGDYSEAIDVLRKALKIAPQSFPPRLNLALALLLANRNDEAEVEIAMAAQIDASAAEAPFLTGILERRRGNRESAVAAFQKSYELGGIDVIYSQYELGQLYEELNQPEAAARSYRLFLTFVQTGPQADRARRQLSSLPAEA